MLKSFSLVVSIAFRLGALPSVDAQAQGSNMVPLGGASVAVICPNGNYMRFTSISGQNAMSCSYVDQPDVGPFAMLNNFNVDSNGPGSAQALTDGGTYYMNVQGHGTTEFMTSTPYNRPNNQGNYTLQTSTYSGPSGTGFHNYESAYNFYIQPDGRYKIQAVANNGPYDSSAMPIYNGPDVGYWNVQDDETIFTPNSVGPSGADLFSIVLAPSSIVTQSFVASDNLASNSYFNILNSATGCYWAFSNGLYSPSGSSASASSFMISNSTIHPGLNGLYDITQQQYVSIPSNSSAATGSPEQVTRETELLIIPAGSHQYVLWTQTNPGGYLVSRDGGLYPTGGQPEINTFVSVGSASTSSSYNFQSSTTASSSISDPTDTSSSSQLFASTSSSSTDMMSSSSSDLISSLSSSSSFSVNSVIVSTTSSGLDAATTTTDAAVSPTSSTSAAQLTAAPLNGAGVTTGQMLSTTSSEMTSMSIATSQIASTTSLSSLASHIPTSSLTTSSPSAMSTSTSFITSSSHITSESYLTTVSVSVSLSTLPGDTTSTKSSVLSIASTSSLTILLPAQTSPASASYSLAAVGTTGSSATRTISTDFGQSSLSFTTMTAYLSSVDTISSAITLHSSLTTTLSSLSAPSSIIPTTALTPESMSGSASSTIAATTTSTSTASIVSQTCDYSISGYSCGIQPTGGAAISAARIASCADACNADISCRAFSVDESGMCTYYTLPECQANGATTGCSQMASNLGAVNFSKLTTTSVSSAVTSGLMSSSATSNTALSTSDTVHILSASIVSTTDGGNGIAPISQTTLVASNLLYSLSASMSSSTMQSATGDAKIAALPTNTNVLPAAPLASVFSVTRYTNATGVQVSTQATSFVTTMTVSQAGSGANVAPQQTNIDIVGSNSPAVGAAPVINNGAANVGAAPASVSGLGTPGGTFTTLTTLTTLVIPTQVSAPLGNSVVGSTLNPILNSGGGASPAGSSVSVVGSAINVAAGASVVASSSAPMATIVNSSGPVVGSPINVGGGSSNAMSTVNGVQTMSANSRASSTATALPSVSALPASTSDSSILKSSVSCLIAVLSVLLLV